MLNAYHIVKNLFFFIRSLIILQGIILYALNSHVIVIRCLKWYTGNHNKVNYVNIIRMFQLQYMSNIVSLLPGSTYTCKYKKL